MSLASKIGWAGVALALLTAGIWVRGFPRSGTRPDPNHEVGATFVPKNEIMKMQKVLHNEGHYQGNVDGIFGRRTRAGLRAYQKAKKLPFTGQVDVWTASRLGIRPESTWHSSKTIGSEVGISGDNGAGQTKKDKPSAGIRNRDVVNSEQSSP